MQSDAKSLVPSLERGLSILELLPRTRCGLTLSQLTRYLNLPKSSVYCLLRTLENSGYVHRDPVTSKYRVSLRVCSLAHQALISTGLRDESRSYLATLAQNVKLTVHMAVLEQGSCMLIEKIAPLEMNRIATWVGKHLSLHCTALGKALAAYLPEDQVDAIIREQGLLRHNDNTICSFRRLQQELALVRRRGYAVDDEEEEIGVRCIGVPVLDGDHAIAAISLVGTTTLVHSGNLDQLARQLKDTAHLIAERVKAGHQESNQAASISPPVLDWQKPRSMRLIP